jgi:hypothetical protein
MLFNKLIQASQDLQSILEKTTDLKETHDFPWPAISYGPCRAFRRADLDIIDVRDKKKLWMLHLVVYPHYSDGSPIYGFDIISGPRKVTGAFHDFSPCDHNSSIITRFGENVKDFIPKKQRELPEWAKNIFSPFMIAAGNIREDSEELDTLLALAIKNLQMHIDSTANNWSPDEYYRSHQSWYVYNQRKNPHTARVMESLGIEKEQVRKYIDECLWPVEEAWMDSRPVLHN